MNKSMKH